MIFHLGDPCDLDPKVLGSKGVGLVRMTQLNLPVPDGFILPIGLHMRPWSEVEPALNKALMRLEEKMGLFWGGDHNQPPLLVSVRSSGLVSMPGMMDTFLNVGLSVDNQKAFARRLGSVEKANQSFETLKKTFLQAGIGLGGGNQSLHDAIRAVWRSWSATRAQAYRYHHGLDHDQGVAVIVQVMVFGHGDEPSGTGVAFTRNPLDGRKGLFGEYLLGHQGEALVGGHKTPLPLSQLEQDRPELFQKLAAIGKILEADRGSMQEVEFTFERGELWILQTRSAKHSPTAAFQKVWDDIQDHKIDLKSGLNQLDPKILSGLLHGQIKTHNPDHVLAQGLAASPGVVRGRICLDAKAIDQESILLLPELTPDHIPQALACAGVITGRGGMTSHGAVVMRGAGKPLISDVSIQWHRDGGGIVMEGHPVVHGQEVTLNGQTGMIYQGHQEIMLRDLAPCVQQILAHGQHKACFSVMANADTPEDLRQALSWGAQGIGLCRSEHMMLKPQCLFWLQVFFLATDEMSRQEALGHLESAHRHDVLELVAGLEGKPMIFRLLDPPLHEFLPHAGQDLKLLALALKTDEDVLWGRIDQLREVNPMLGQRGVRLGLTHPSIYRMQLRVLVGLPVQVLVPFVMDVSEIEAVKVMAREEGFQGSMGVMIEVPRAALLAIELADKVDFFSFGTNDLTQMTFGLSRDDAGNFLKRAALPDPFVHLDEKGVGALMAWACDRGRQVNSNLKISICGEHAGDVDSMDFFKRIGVDSLSVSPFKLLPTRLAAIQCGLS